MGIDIYETRRMIRALEQRKPTRTVFLDTFFNEVDVSTAETVDIDIDRGGERLMANFTSHKKEGKVVERRGFKTRSYKPPYVKPKTVCEADQFFGREMGETIYNGMEPAVKAAAMVGKDLGMMEDMIIRREEWMAAQGILTGVIKIQGEGVDDTCDFDMRADHNIVLSGDALWSSITTAKPIDNIIDWVEKVEEDSGLTATHFFGGKQAMRYLRSNEVQVVGEKSLFDYRAIDIGEISPRKMQDSLKYHGTLKEAGIDMYSYAEKFYNDADGKTYDMMPTNKILIGCKAARCVRHYGAIKDLSSLQAIKRFPKTWVTEDPSARYVMVQSAPLMAPHQIDAFLVVTVC